MNSRDNRQSKRIIQNNTSCVFFCDRFKCKVLEFSSNGFSFLISKDAYSFFKGQLIDDFKILNSDGFEIIQAKGIVVHIKIHDQIFYRVGIKYTSKKLDNTIFGKIRVPRVSPDVKIQVQIKYNNINLHGHILDYTPRSARICLDNTIKNLSDCVNKLDHAEISINGINGKFIQQISGSIIRKDPDRFEIVIQFVDDFLDVQSINLHSNISEGLNNFDHIIFEMDHLSSVNDAFKALVCDWKLYFNKLSTYLLQEEAKNNYSNPRDEALFFEVIEKKVFPKLREFIEKLNSIAGNINVDDSVKYKTYYKENLVPYLRQAPVVASIIDKIHGYHGDFNTIKQFVNYPYKGSSFFAKILNKFVLSLEPVTAHVDRLEFLCKEMAMHYSNVKKEFSILSLGAGPALEIFEFLKDNDFEKSVYITLVDLDANALTDFSERVQYYHKKNVSINLVNHNLKDLIRKRKKLIYEQKFDFTYCAGMLDYFNEKTSKLIVSILINHTKKGCPFYITNVHSNNFARYFMDYGGGWEIIHRNEEEFLNLIPRDVKSSLFFDDTRTNIYLKGNAV